MINEGEINIFMILDLLVWEQCAFLHTHALKKILPIAFKILHM